MPGNSPENKLAAYLLSKWRADLNMKLLLLVGGLLGFSIGLIFSWDEESPGPACLWHACLAAYLTAILMRWWGNAWRKSLEAATRERLSKPEPINTSLLSKLGKS